METKTSSIIFLPSTIFPKCIVCDFTLVKSLSLNFDLKCASTIFMALSPEIRIIAIAPTPDEVANAIIVSLFIVVLMI